MAALYTDWNFRMDRHILKNESDEARPLAGRHIDVDMSGGCFLPGAV
jgi:hypothetical protein